MGSLRNAIGSRLPHRWTNLARGFVRGVDQLLGLPLSPLRPGAVAMYHVGRCGSSVLGDMLDRHPAVRWDREIFFHRRAELARVPGPWDPGAYLHRRMWSAGRRWYGFEVKILPQQDLVCTGRSLAELVEDVADAGTTHHVVLRRRNSLRRLISAMAGVRSGTRHATSADAAAARERVRLDVAAIRLARGAEPLDLVACLDTIESSYDELTRLLAERRCLDLTFEEDVAATGPQRGYARICEFLGLPVVAAEPHTVRLHGSTVPELLQNPDEVAEALRGTPHEWMLGA